MCIAYVTQSLDKGTLGTSSIMGWIQDVNAQGQGTSSDRLQIMSGANSGRLCFDLHHALVCPPNCHKTRLTLRIGIIVGEPLVRRAVMISRISTDRYRSTSVSGSTP